MALCCDVGLTGCDRPIPLPAPDDPEPPALPEERQLRRTRELTALTSALLQAWPDVPPDRRVGAASPQERTILCGWYARATGVALSKARGDGFRPLVDGQVTLQPSGDRLHLRDFAGCLRDFPACDDAVGAARACIARQLESLPNDAPSCSATCTWGLAVEPRTEREPG